MEQCVAARTPVWVITLLSVGLRSKVLASLAGVCSMVITVASWWPAEIHLTIAHLTLPLTLTYTG